MTETSLLPLAAQAANLTLADVVDELLQDALAQAADDSVPV
jgi:hypothetical protein